MSFGPPISAAQFERLTRPRLLIFLSADLQNSTRLKQSRHPAAAQTWLTTVLGFMKDFALGLRGQLEEISRTKRLELRPLRSWKTLGDEVVFVIEPSRIDDCNWIIEAFRQAIANWNLDRRARLEPEPGDLLVQGTAWSAGFPVANAVILRDDRPTGLESDEELETYEDYLGPSMDIGFRLSKLATPRRLVVSVDMAWLLLASGYRHGVHFEERTHLRGVAEDDGYPLLWLEPEVSRYRNAEKAMLGFGRQSDFRSMKDLCARYIREFGVPNYLPFIPDKGNESVDYERDRVTRVQFLRERIFLVSDDTSKVAKGTSSATGENALLKEATAQRPKREIPGKENRRPSRGAARKPTPRARKR
jgi:class 3 adenylate cyclase